MIECPECHKKFDPFKAVLTKESKRRVLICPHCSHHIRVGSISGR